MKIIKNKSKLQLIFLIISFILLTTFFVIGYTNTFTITRKDAIWKEHLIFPFYFTTITNVLIFIFFFIRFFAKKSLLKKEIFKLFEIIVIVNASITMLVYWTLLAYDSFTELIKQRSYINIFTNISVHLIMPLFAIINFFYEHFVLKTSYKIKQNIYIFSLKITSFPLIWLAFENIFYFSLGHQREDAFYDFLDIANNPFWMTLIYFVGIIGIYFALSLLFSYFNNRFLKKSSKNIK